MQVRIQLRVLSVLVRRSVEPLVLLVLYLQQDILALSAAATSSILILIVSEVCNSLLINQDIWLIVALFLKPLN